MMADFHLITPGFLPFLFTFSEKVRKILKKTIKVVGKGGKKKDP